MKITENNNLKIKLADKLWIYELIEITKISKLHYEF